MIIGIKSLLLIRSPINRLLFTYLPYFIRTVDHSLCPSTILSLSVQRRVVETLGLLPRLDPTYSPYDYL